MALTLQMSVKRVFDILVSGVVLVIALPAAMVAVLVVQCYFPAWRVICLEERVGKDSKALKLLKLRTLPVGYVVDSRNIDIQIPRLVAIVRALAIDEIPQLLQVLFGQMSLIGPTRPMIRDEAAARYGDWADEIQKMRPGFVTEYGLDLHLRRVDAPWAYNQQATIQALHYSRDWSLAADLRVLRKVCQLAPRIIVAAMRYAGKVRSRG
jgi:lipopolysaccharide/colanic/teichoic acid biosynthesis glycosyltransferase